ncbi:hypothetical protein BH10CYA1_BH10CYA1_47320 [soil metagenome]
MVRLLSPRQVAWQTVQASPAGVWAGKPALAGPFDALAVKKSLQAKLIIHNLLAASTASSYAQTVQSGLRGYQPYELVGWEELPSAYRFTA